MPTHGGIVLRLTRPDLAELLIAVLNKGALFKICAKGYSMFPFIRNDDIVAISPILDSRISVGDVLAFFAPESGQIAIHRMVCKKGKHYIMKGDNSYNIDGIVCRNRIVGRVISVERGGKKVLFCGGFEKYMIAFLSRHKILLPLQIIMKKFSVIATVDLRPRCENSHGHRKQFR